MATKYLISVDGQTIPRLFTESQKDSILLLEEHVDAEFLVQNIETPTRKRRVKTED